MALLEIRALTVEFAGVPMVSAVNGINLSIEPT